MVKKKRKDPIGWTWALLGYVALLLLVLAVGKVMR